MNRHIIDYAPLCVEPLGAPIRKEPEKPEPKWEPAGPYHEKRVVDGRLEVRAKALPSPLPTAPVTPLVIGVDMAAPTEWQDGAPPSVGWWRSCYAEDENPSMASYWSGERWTHYLALSCVDSYSTYYGGACADNFGWTKVWMHPRLDLPEPQ